MDSVSLADSAARSRREAQALLLEAPPREESDGWMLGYLDLLTLLLVLFVLLLSLRGASVAPEAPSRDAPTVMISPLVLEASVAENPAPSNANDPSASGSSINDASINDASMNGASMNEAPALEMAAILPRLLAAPASAPAPAWQAVPASPSNGETARPALLVETDVALAVASVPAPREVSPPEPNIEAALAVARGASVMERQLSGIEGVQVSRERERTVLRIEDRLLFPSADVEIAESGNQLLDRLLPALVAFDGEISVEGHTDSRTITTDRFPSNWELAAARASAVLRYLSRNGVDAGQLRAIGYGPTRPLASNDSEDGRAQNRRVELVLTPQGDEPMSSLPTL